MNSNVYPEELRNFIEAIIAEVKRAERHGKIFSSLHECYAVIYEEIDELWDITRLKKKDRSAQAIQNELIQIAAMALKGLQSMKNFSGGDC